jgi:nucleoside-diphosphate-sugar epimerase
MFEKILAEAKLYALEAVVTVERIAKEALLETGIKILGADKNAQAKKLALDAYKIATAGIPVLNMTMIDDELVKQGVDAAVDWIFEKVKDVLHLAADAIPDNSVSDPSLKPGGLE